MPLQQLIYRSAATGRTDSLLNAATILAEAQRNNDRDGLTGVLAAHEGRYLQLIEGEATVLDNLLSRLARDPRHRDIEVLERVEIAGRRFSSWSMANALFFPETAPALARLMTDSSPSIEDLNVLLVAAAGSAPR